MRGLFEKDIRIIKNQKKMMLIFAGMGVLLLLSGVEISFILPYMASVMTSVAISTISYDSMDNGNSFLFTLPVRRKDYATEKYFFVCGFGAVSALIVAIACGILLLVRKSEMTAGVLGVETMTCLLIVLLLADLLVPLQIKFGAEIYGRSSAVIKFCLALPESFWSHCLPSYPGRSPAVCWKSRKCKKYQVQRSRKREIVLDRRTCFC